MFMSVRTATNLTAAGLFLASVVLPPIGGLGEAAQATAGVGVLMAVLWVTEAIPLAATALLPAALFTVLGIASVGELSSSYANPVIFLFLGGFLIAKAIESRGLHKRLAYAILGRTGGEPRRVVLSIMLATAFLSLWISNTAAAMVAAPIAASVAVMRSENDGFAPALMLGVAYSATIGGMGSLIGTPPNALLVAYMEEVHGVVIGFAQWMLVGLPVVIVLLPSTWLLLTRFAFRIENNLVSLELEPLPPVSAGEFRVAMIAVLTALGWMARPFVTKLFPGIDITDAGIAMTGALLLFVIPGGHGSRRLLDWETAATLRWDVLILFGGGLSLASAIDSSGLAGWIGEMARNMQGLPIVWTILAMALIVVYLGELASNTAMAAVFIPIAGAIAIGTAADPLSFALPVAMAASIGFMLPVATPPNAIVFANQSVDRANMLRAGAPLDLLGIAIALFAGIVLGPMVF